MRLDVRLPIGGLFTVIGILLVVDDDPSVPDVSGAEG